MAAEQAPIVTTPPNMEGVPVADPNVAAAAGMPQAPAGVEAAPAPVDPAATGEATPGPEAAQAASDPVEGAGRVGAYVKTFGNRDVLRTAADAQVQTAKAMGGIAAKTAINALKFVPLAGRPLAGAANALLGERLNGVPNAVAANQAYRETARNTYNGLRNPGQATAEAAQAEPAPVDRTKLDLAA